MRRVEQEPPATGGGPRRIVVEGTIEGREDAHPTRREPFRLEYVEGPRGGGEAKDVRLDARAEWREAMDHLTALWTEPVPVPPRPVQAGERFDLEGVADLEPWKRAAFYVYTARYPTLPHVVTPILGASWIVSAADGPAGLEALVRLRLRQTSRAPIDESGTRTVGYAAALDRDRTVVAATGVTRLYDSTLTTRVRYADAEADYVVDVTQRATLETSRAE